MLETIRTYTNTKCELEMAKVRLSLLLDRKEQLYCKYFPVTQKIKQDIISGGDHKNDKMDRYLHELHDVDIGTGKSLAGEIEYQQALVDKTKRYLEDMGDTLSKMCGIEYALYYEIVVNGTRISRAVERIAEEYNRDTQTIWKYHYNKIKKDVKRVIKYSESTVKSVVQCTM